MNRMSSHELSEWMAYYSIEPFGAERDNLHAGIIAKAIYDVHIEKPAERAKLTPADFILGAKTSKPDDGLTVAEKVRAWALLNKGA